MAIYVFNLLTGYQPNGVDNAQGYRAKMFAKEGIFVKHFFTEIPDEQTIAYYENLGVGRDSICFTLQYFTDNHTLIHSISASKTSKELYDKLLCSSMVENGAKISLYRDGSRIATLIKTSANSDFLESIQYFKNECLLRQEYYTQSLLYATHFVTATNERGFAYAKPVRRTFYNIDASVVFHQILRANSYDLHFENGLYLSREEVHDEFVCQLHLTDNDTVIIDRPSITDITGSLLKYGSKARILAFLHAAHYYDKGVDPSWLGWNPDYFYLIKHTHLFDGFIVSTPAQKDDFILRMQEIGHTIPEVHVIPAGAIDKLVMPTTPRKPFSIMTASRMHPRKKIEFLIRAVAKAHTSIPEISLDIFGIGFEDYTRELKQLIVDLDASDYIHMLGHQDISNQYQKYEMYISASTGESFGLSNLEALQSGDILIGLDVKYGNRLFIHSGENGYLIPAIPATMDDEIDSITTQMADSIVKVFSNKEKLAEFHKRSYEIASQFLEDNIAAKWKSLLT